jgi:ElaB/YqjD/DUF883 family membrane-anchored ribosome-binding protein
MNMELLKHELRLIQAEINEEREKEEKIKAKIRELAKIHENEKLCYPQKKEKIRNIEREIERQKDQLELIQEKIEELEKKEKEYKAQLEELTKEEEERRKEKEVEYKIVLEELMKMKAMMKEKEIKEKPEERISIGGAVGILLGTPRAQSPSGILELDFRIVPIDVDIYLGMGSIEYERAPRDPYFYFYGIETGMLKIKNLNFPLGVGILRLPEDKEGGFHFSAGICGKWITKEENKYFLQGRWWIKRGKNEKLMIILGICYAFE